MYNISPINITYRNHQMQQAKMPNASGNSSENEQIQGSLDDGQGRRFPNGREVTIDYSGNKINIAQIVTDFNSTVLAINAPPDLVEEVNLYLGLVTKESEKIKPSKSIIFSNLKNASKITDEYIAQSLNKPSKVVEGWVDALSKQNVELKSDPNHINPDFKVNLPESAPKKPESTPLETPKTELLPPQENISTQNTSPFAPGSTIQTLDDISIEPLRSSQNAAAPMIEPLTTLPLTPVVESIAPTLVDYVQAPSLNEKTVVSQEAPYETQIRQIFAKAKQTKDPAEALDAFSKAILLADKTGNNHIKAASHFERGKIFDDNDLVDNALKEYSFAASGDDYNLKTKAHLKMAEIYDDFARFEPALGHYHRAVVFAGEANNLAGQSTALGGIATMYAQRYDKENTLAFNGLTVDTALGTNSPKVIGRAYSTVARNYEYISENKSSLDSYKNAVVQFSKTGESYDQMAKNYFGAAELMQKLGNEAKANSLLSKARLCQQKSQLYQQM